MKDNNECSPELYNDATDLEVEKLKEIYMPTALTFAQAMWFPPYNSFFFVFFLFFFCLKQTCSKGRLHNFPAKQCLNYYGSFVVEPKD